MIYFYDGTKDGFLTALVTAYDDPEARLTSVSIQLPLGQQAVSVRSDHKRAEKAEARLLAFDPDCMSDLNFLLRSGENTRDTVAFNYFRYLCKQKRPVGRNFAEGCVVEAMECIRRVTTEIHRMKGFIRFMECESGALYAPFAPDHDISDLLVPHFRARLPEHPFIIHDVPRKKAAVYDGRSAFVAPLEQTEVALSADEAGWRALWKRYYHSVNIPSRARLRQMRGYMPVRYWKYLPEKFSPLE